MVSQLKFWTMLMTVSVLSVGCDQSSTSPSTTTPPAIRTLMLSGEMTVVGPDWLTAFSACLDGRPVGGLRGGDWNNHPLGRITFPIGLTPFHSPSAAAIQPGLHELVVVVSWSTYWTQLEVTYTTDARTRINILDQDTREVLATRVLDSQRALLRNYEGLRWTIDVDALGQVRSVVPSKASAEEVALNHSNCVHRFAS